MALVQACRVSSLSEATSAVISSTDTEPHWTISSSRPGSDAKLRRVFAHPWEKGFTTRRETKRGQIRIREDVEAALGQEKMLKKERKKASPEVRSRGGCKPISHHP